MSKLKIIYIVKKFLIVVHCHIFSPYLILTVLVINTNKICFFPLYLILAILPYRKGAVRQNEGIEVEQ